MPEPPLHWVHVIVNTHASWLHGDRRGFRARRHRIHSSGDYRHRPPEGEHADLRAYHAARSPKPVTLRFDLRVRVLRAFVEKMRSMRHRIIACFVGDTHLHAVVELPANYAQVIATVGVCKQKASHAIRDELPGTVWSRNGEYKRIKDPSHLRNAYGYVRTRQERGTIVWSHRADENWIDDPSIGVIVMGIARRQLRLPRTSDARA
jgi:REP element-mobilizing transposase RayT